MLKLMRNISGGNKKSSSPTRQRPPSSSPQQQQHQQQQQNVPAWIRNRNWDLKYYVEPFEAWPNEAEEYLVLNTNEDVEAFKNWLLQHQGGGGGNGGMPDNKCFACRGRDNINDDWDYGTVVKVNQNLLFRYRSGDEEMFPIQSVNFLELVQFAMDKRTSPPSPPANNKSPLSKPLPILSLQQQQQQQKKKKNHVFLSYSRQDLQFANYLRAILQQEYGIEVWMDKQHLTPGMNWSTELEKALDSSCAVVVVMTPDARKSTFVQIEILHAIDQDKPIFPILLIGSPLFLLKSTQYEDMRGGLSAKPSPVFIQNLRSAMSTINGTTNTTADIDHTLKKKTIQLNIVKRDVREVECDVLVMKYARSFYGADQIVFNAFKDYADNMADPTFNIDIGPLTNGKHVLRETNACIVAKNVLYIPTVPLIKFNYNTIRQLAMDAIQILLENEDNTGRQTNKLHIVMTIHGVGFGLDEANCLIHQLQGLLDGLTSSSGKALDMIERMTIIDWDSTVVERLNSVAVQFFQEIGLQWDGSSLCLPGTPKEDVDRGTDDIQNKSYALVVTADFSQPGEDTFCYGIQEPVRAMGLLCERMKTNSVSLKGDITVLQQKLQRIQKSKVVIFNADCFSSSSTTTTTSTSGSNDISDVDGFASSAMTTSASTTNTSSKEILCLLLGCAWGAGIPTRLITQENDCNVLEFDWDHYLQYKSIKDLSDQVSKWLKDALD